MTRPAGAHWLTCIEAATSLVRPEQLKVPNESERATAASRLGPRWASELMDSLRDLAKRTASSLKSTHKGTTTWQHMSDKDADRLELNKDTKILRICFNDLAHIAAEDEPWEDQGTKEPTPPPPGGNLQSIPKQNHLGKPITTGNLDTGAEAPHIQREAPLPLGPLQTSHKRVPPSEVRQPSEPTMINRGRYPSQTSATRLGESPSSPAWTEDP
jgi:hypothetical protein